MSSSSSGQIVEEAAEIYERFFVPALFGQWSDHLLDRVDDAAPTDVLDIGCGTGALARTARDRFPAASVVGLDPNTAMLAVADARDSSVDWQRGTGESLPFSGDSFDLVLSQFALMFSPDPDTFVCEMERVAKPTAAVGFGVWASLSENSGYAAMHRLLRRLFGDTIAESIGAPFSMGDLDAVSRLAHRHLEGSSTETVRGQARFPSLDSWLQIEIRGWTLADELTDEQFDVLRAEARTELSSFVAADGRVEFPVAAILTTGRAPR